MILQGSRQLEKPVDSRAPGMNDSLGDSLVVEMKDFFTEDEILQESRAAGVGPERILIV